MANEISGGYAAEELQQSPVWLQGQTEPAAAAVAAHVRPSLAQVCLNLGYK